MSLDDLREQIGIELRLMDETIRLIENTIVELGEKEPSALQRAGLGALLMNFYMGIENILKRIAKHENLPLPTGPRWHLDLFDLFRKPLPSGAPALFNPSLSTLLRDYRNFRHVVIHGYGILLKWLEMSQCVRASRDAFAAFQEAVESYLRRA